MVNPGLTTFWKPNSFACVGLGGDHPVSECAMYGTVLTLMGAEQALRQVN